LLEKAVIICKKEHNEDGMDTTEEEREQRLKLTSQVSLKLH